MTMQSFDTPLHYAAAHSSLEETVSIPNFDAFAAMACDKTPSPRPLSESGEREIYLDEQDLEAASAAVDAFYDLLSFHPKERPDYRKIEGSFATIAQVALGSAPDAEVLPSGAKGFVAAHRAQVARLQRQGLGAFQVERDRRMELVGNVAHVVSSYVVHLRGASHARFKAGVRSIELVRFGRSWRIVSLVSTEAGDARELASATF